jgi:hypothetical protein
MIDHHATVRWVDDLRARLLVLERGQRDRLDRHDDAGQLCCRIRNPQFAIERGTEKSKRFDERYCDSCDIKKGKDDPLTDN